MVAPAAAITSAEIRTLRNTGRLAARSTFPPIAAAAIPACAMVDAVAPNATTGTMAIDGISHQRFDSWRPVRSAAASVAAKTRTAASGRSWA